VVMQRYGELWAELRERRRSDPDLHPRLTPRRRPTRQDPFTVFATYPTEAISSDTRFEVLADLALDKMVARRGLPSVRFAGRILPSDDFLKRLVRSNKQSFTLAEVVAEMPDFSPTVIARWLVWLAKAGAISFVLTQEDGERRK
jgi:hypothetical protein